MKVVALVSGGASGLGRATVERLCSAGFSVVIADRDAERGEALARELGKTAVFAPVDVTDASSVERGVEAAVERGTLRVAVSCAGVGWASRLVTREGEPHELELFHKILAVNLVGTFNVMRFAAAAMMRNTPDEDSQRGVLVNTASVAAFDGQVGQVAYAASKGAVAAMTLPAARDLAKAGIRVVTVAPGTFDTPMLAGLPDKARESLAATIPNPQRLGRPSEYAALVHHIVENAYLNGEVVRLDGALRMAPK